LEAARLADRALAAAIQRRDATHYAQDQESH
jgi:hypothetical protein